MKTIKEQTLPNGRRRVTVELDRDEVLLPVRDDCYYRLGGQLDEVVPSHVLQETREASWCHLEQKWID